MVDIEAISEKSSVSCRETMSESSTFHENLPQPPEAGVLDRGRSLLNKALYGVAAGYNYLVSQAGWSKIGDYNLYLGGIPLKNRGDLQKMKELGISHLICLVSDSDLRKGILNEPVSLSDWKSQNIEVVHFNSPAFLPLSLKEIHQGVTTLEMLLGEENRVYIHGKEGQGKSAAIVAAFLMKQKGITLDEAIAYIQQFQPQVYLSADERQAVFNYFNRSDASIEELSMKDKAYQMTSEKLSALLMTMLDYVIEGSSNMTPETLKDWISSVRVESTDERRDRYLKEFEGDCDKAVDAAIERSHGYGRKVATAVTGYIPFVGSTMSYSITLWHQLREVALIAALYGHDLKDPQVKMKILAALLEGDLMKLPAQSVDLLAKMIMKKALVKAGLNSIPGAAIPAHLIFNYFTDNSAKVSTYARKTFKT